MKNKPSTYLRHHMVCGLYKLGIAALFGCCLNIAHGAISEETVYFDVSAELIDKAIPTPTAALAELPGYPNDANRLTLAGQLFLPDPNVYPG
ncbi:MAG: hypothetical protein ACQKBV_09945, partial [Puniceicoccales bacterium]